MKSACVQKISTSSFIVKIECLKTADKMISHSIPALISGLGKQIKPKGNLLSAIELSGGPRE